VLKIASILVAEAAIPLNLAGSTTVGAVGEKIPLLARYAVRATSSKVIPSDWALWPASRGSSRRP
jgi:hypothetical protein